MRKLLLAGAAVVAFGSPAMAADCPHVTLADAMGVAPGAHPQQYELGEFEAAGGCTLTFQENPSIGDLNARIDRNGELASVAERLPAEPLVVVPYDSIGQYGGVLDALSNATEAGTSDLLSVRHVSLVRYQDDLETIVPNVAQSWEWNGDFTQLTFELREGHKWSDGAPFTAHDVVFWYDNMLMDPNVVEQPRDLWLAGGEPMLVEALDDHTVRFTMSSPKPGFLSGLAVDYAQPFQPRHFLGQFHPDINPDADAAAKAAGFETGYEVITFYYGGSDWKDVPTPYLKDPSKIAGLPAAVVPTLESHIVVADTTDGRHLVANPYFFQVDTAGNQLPYIEEISETYVPDNEVRLLKLINGEVDYKSQSLGLPDAPTLLDGQEAGNYTVDLRPQISVPSIAFNVTSEDPVKRDVFGDVRFRLAVSHAIDRAEINDVAFFDLGEAKQFIGFDPAPGFVTEEQIKFATAFDPDYATATLDELGLADANGDGFRELPNGDPLVLNLQFTTQGMPTVVVDLLAQHLRNVGLNASIQEVTTDEYRAAQSANELDVMLFQMGRPVAAVQSDPQIFTVPFAGYFDLRVGMLWDEWNQTGGAQGIEPPQWTKDMAAKVLEWQTYPLGTEESDRLGNELVQMMIDNMPIIGIVQSPNPIYHSNNLNNFMTPLTWSYDFYRTYPYRPTQWWLAEE